MFFKRVVFVVGVVFCAIAVCAQNDHTALSMKQNTDSAKYCYDAGIAYGKKSELDSALLYTQKAVHLFEKDSTTDIILLANAYQSLGIINKLLGKYEEAIACYNKSEEIYIRKENEKLLGFVYSNKANIYFIQQDYSKAEDYQNRALNIFMTDSIKHPIQLSILYNNLGNIFKRKNNYQLATESYRKSLNLHKPNDTYFSAISNLGDCYNHINMYNKAKSFYLEANHIAENKFGVNNIKTAACYLDYATFLSKQQENKQALSYFYKALEIFEDQLNTKHPSLSNGYNDLGEHYLRNGAMDSALYYFQKSLVSIAPEFANMDIRKNPLVHEVLSKTHYLKSIKNKALVLSRIAGIKKDTAYYTLSINTFDLAIETINSIRSGYVSEESKLFLADNEFETYSDALETCFELYTLTGNKKYTEKLLSYSEGGKSAVLNEAIKTSNALNIGGIPDSLLVQEQKLAKSIWSYEELLYEENKKKSPDKNKMGYWNRYLFEKKQEYGNLTTYLENNFEEYHTLKHAGNKIQISNVQSKLLPGDVLIEYFLTRHKIYTFIMSKDDYQVYAQELSEQFNRSLDTLLQALSNNNFSDHGFKEFEQYHTSSYFIYSTLLKPYEQFIKDKHLIIIPDGKLAYLPFEVLTTNHERFNRINYRELPYLLYKNQCSYSYSAQFLIDNTSLKQTAHKKLGAFAPTYNNLDSLPGDYLALRQEYREKLFPLKGIKLEVQRIAELLHGDKYIDMAATEKTFKRVAPEYDILHLAMHTIMDDENPMYSKMAFTQKNDSIEDGFLNTYELYNMKLNSRMAVLSSCNSGSGKLHRGEGVMSLARGFIYSGCPSIIMTLWSVEDNSGVELMTSFYENLLNGKTKAEAIRQSKIDFIKNADQLKAHPYFWSGYVVIGNNSALFKTNRLWVILSIVCIIALTGVTFRKRIARLFQ